MLTAVLLAVLAAGFNAAASVLQRRAGRQESGDTFSARALWDQVRHPVWALGLLAILAGYATQALALALGRIAVVQPVLVVELPCTVLLAALVFRARPGRAEWLAVAALSLGLAAFVGCLAPDGGDPRGVPGPVWTVGMAASVAVVVGLALLGRRGSGAHRAALLGVATGVGFGLCAVLTAAAGAAAAGGLPALLSAWPTYAVLVVGPASFLLLQAALRAGSLIASQPGLTLANPVVAVVWGVAAFGERVRGGAWLLGAASGALLIVAGTVLLARSPVLSGSRRRDASESPAM